MSSAIAYLNTRYPAVSHTFIQREVEALRRMGLAVVPFSIRKPRESELRGVSAAEEAARTVYVLSGAIPFLVKVLVAAVGSPAGCARAVFESQRLSPPGIRQRVRHLAYALEAMVVARAMRRRGLHAVHVHMANHGAMVALLACRFDRSLEYSLTIHGSAEFFDVHRLRLREKVESAAFVRCISNFCRAQTMTWCSPQCWPRLHVIHCGVPLEDFPLRVERSDAGPLRILTVGRLVPIKGYLTLLDGLASLPGDLEWELRMVGDGPEEPRLRDHARTLGILERVAFLGPLSPVQVRDELETAGVLVVSSFMEGVPVVLMEAMASGVPVVATNVGGVSELVRDGVSGRLVSPASPAELAGAIRALAEDPAARSAGALEARRTVERSYCAATTASQVLELHAKGHGISVAS